MNELAPNTAELPPFEQFLAKSENGLASVFTEVEPDPTDNLNTATTEIPTPTRQADHAALPPVVRVLPSDQPVPRPDLIDYLEAA
jgi:hypothetical protein